jgi:3-oxoacid CoA-transferase subunit B/3-oxoadipate CoA-transferase beta subunit
VRRVVVVMDHCEKSGAPKLLHRCGLPLTGAGVVDLLITDLGVFEIDKASGVTLIELADGASIDEIRAKTEAAFKVAETLAASAA